MGKIAGISFLIPAESTVEIVQDLTLYYVMKGTAIVDIRGRDNIRMIEEDILAVNQSEECRVEVLEGITAAIEFSHEQIYSLLDGKNRYVECSSANVRTGSFNDLKEKVKKLISSLFRDEFSSVAFERNSYDLLLTLLSGYSEEVLSGGRREEVSSWIENSYRQVITLEGAAEHFHLTPQYFSRWFAEEFESTFLKYLSNVRCRNALKELMSTDYTILRIALDNGFPNSASFTRAFAELYGETPLKYRKNHERKTDRVSLPDDRVKEYIDIADNSTEENRSIVVDCGKDVERLRPYWKTLCNLSDIYGLADHELQSQVRELQASMKFKYARVRLDNNEKENDSKFYREGKAMEFLRELGLLPLFVIDYRLCVSNEGFLGWLQGFAGYIAMRFGIRELYIELLYDSVFDGRKAQGYHAYAELIRKALEGIRVGCKIVGPGFLLNKDGSSLTEFLKYNSDLDFISIKCAPIEISDNSNPEVRRVTESDYFLHQYRLAKELSASSGCDKEIIITDWKTSITGFDILNDSAWMAARIVQSVLKGYGKLTSLPMDCPLDLMQNRDSSSTIQMFSGSAGLMTIDQFKKPSFYAFQFLSHLDDEYLYSDEHMMITSSGGNYFQIILQNVCPLSYQYYMYQQKENVNEKIPDEFYESRTSYKITLVLEGLEDLSWFAKVRRINEKDGNVYNAWLEMNYHDMSFMGRDEMELLRSMSVPKMHGMKLRAENGRLEIPIELVPNEIQHIHLIPVR